MSETVGQAVEQQAPRQLSEERWADLLPSHISPAKFQRWALSVLRMGSDNPKTAEAWQRVNATEAGRLSIVAALMDCASLGLEPGRTYHLVPFGGSVTGIIDYQGEVELIWRAIHRPVIANLVHEKDDFAMRGANVPPKHEADWFGDRGPIVGGYAFLHFEQDIYSLVIRMSEADFVKHKAKARSQGVWDEWPEAMRMKTLVHQLRKWVPWSAEIQS